MSHIYIYNTGNLYINQPFVDFDDDVNSFYGVKKTANQIIEKAYINIKSAKVKRLHECWSHIKIARRRSTGEKKLIFANSCKVRLCPCCAWRRSRKFALENHNMLNDINGKYIFLTITIKNVCGAELSSALDSILNGWKRFYQRKDIKNIMLGSIRNLEITYNRKSKTFHPHMHILIHIPTSYFGKYYISQKKWADIWQDCAHLDYTPIIDVRKIKTKSDKSYLEISKYVAKISDFLNLPEKELTEVISFLDTALCNRRIIGYTGDFRTWRREHKLKDEITDAEIISDSSEDWEIFCYEWIYGKNIYKRTENF